MLRIQAVAKPMNVLAQQSAPQSATQPEALPWVYYDSQDIATGAQGLISFFANPSADKTISNLEQGGTIPDPNYFELEAISMDFLAKPSLNSDATGPADDLAEILYTGRATFVLTMGGKEQLRIPATFLHASGGPQIVASGTLTAPDLYTAVQNGVSDGGFYVGKAITLRPKGGFQVQLQLGAAVTLKATRKVRINLCGVLHRPVL